MTCCLTCPGRTLELESIRPKIHGVQGLSCKQPDQEVDTRGVQRYNTNKHTQPRTPYPVSLSDPRFKPTSCLLDTWRPCNVTSSSCQSAIETICTVRAVATPKKTTLPELACDTDYYSLA